MSSLRNHLLFAFVCAEDRLRDGSLRQEDFDELEYLVKSGGEPDPELLTLCFPRMVRSLRNYAKSCGAGTWSEEICLRYWIYHHGHSQQPSCCVSTMEITAFVEGNSRLVYSGGTILRNPYELKLFPGDKVYVHQMAVIMKANATPIK